MDFMLLFSVRFFIVLTSSIAIFLSSWRFSTVRSKIRRLPPGPSGWPLVGMLFHMPRNPVHKIIQFSREFGGMYSLKMGRQAYVVIADAQIAEDLLVKRAATTSSREASYIASKTLWSGMGVIASPQSEIWRKHRQIIKRALRTQGTDNAADVIQAPLNRLRNKLVWRAHDQNELQLAFSEYTLDCFLSMLLGPKHGMVPQSFRQVLDTMNEMLSLMIPLANKEDFFSLLQLLPTSSYGRARRWRARLPTVMNSLLEHVDLSDSSSIGCFGRTLIEMEEEGEITNFEKCSLALVWLAAAHASFPGFLSSFVTSISSRHDVQQCARDELESTPDAEDLSQSSERSLPYCRAVLHEAMRCNSASIDSPHLVTKDIILQDHIIPAGTALVLDKWTINHDETRFQNPMDFEPSRHLQSDSPAPKGVASSNFWIFGTGRRICPAVALSDRIAFLTITRLLQTLEITGSQKQSSQPYIVQCRLRAT